MSARLEEKESIVTDIVSQMLLDEEAASIHTAAQSVLAEETARSGEYSISNMDVTSTTSVKDTWVAISNVSGAEEHANGIAAETRQCFETLKRAYRRTHHCSLSSCIRASC